jgi:hypothetical protein
LAGGGDQCGGECREYVGPQFRGGKRELKTSNRDWTETDNGLGFQKLTQRIRWGWEVIVNPDSL